MLNIKKFKDTKIKCAGLGEVLFDVYPNGAKIGGAPANFAYHCMQHGLNAVVISCVGHDKLGFEARNYLASKFLPALLVDSNKATGTVNVCLLDNGVPTYTFADDTAFDNLECKDIILDTAHDLDIICFGTLAQRSKKSHDSIIKILDSMRDDSIKVFDVNLRSNFYSKEIIDESLKRSNVLKCNEDELPILAKFANLENRNSACDYYDYLKTIGIDCFIFTEGSKQSTVFLNDEISTIKTPIIDVVDTVGAGDAFTATIISSLMKGLSLKVAHQKAVDTAAFVCTKQGAMPKY